MNQQADHFRMLKILHLAMLGGLTFFSIITVAMLLTRSVVPAASEQLEQILQAVAAVFSLASLLVGFNLFKRKITGARNMTGSGEERMMRYRSACILWWALIEWPGIIAIICLYLTGNFVFLALVLFQMSILAVFIPRKENIIVLLNLTADEVARLEGKA